MNKNDEVLKLPDDSGVVIWSQREGDLSWREIDKEVIILDLRSATYLKLNPAGAVLWNRLDAGATLAQLTASLADRFGLDVTRARLDASTFIESCASKGIIERHTPEQP